MLYLFFYLTLQGMQITCRSWCVTGVEKSWEAKAYNPFVQVLVEMVALDMNLQL